MQSLLKKLFIIFFLLAPLDIFPQNGNPQNGRTIELVESIPVETTLDNPGIRNTAEVWLEMINSAKYKIDIEQFYITSEKGEMLEGILNALISAAEKGVKIRIIVDSKMYVTYPDDINRLEQQSPNIIKHVIDFGRLAGGVQHAKFFIIDESEIFLGSQNFDWRAMNHIHELGVRIKEPDIAYLYSALFDSDWDYCEKNDGEPWKNFYMVKRNLLNNLLTDSYYGSVIVTPVMSPSPFIPIENFQEEKNLLEIIDSAREEVCLQFMTYKSSLKEGGAFSLDSALINAASRGVKVNLIVSDWSIGEPAIKDLKRLAGINNIEVKYSSIPEWSGGHLPYARVEHLKFAVADENECWIGTANAEKSYFTNSRNVGVVAKNGKFALEVKNIFMKSWNGPYTHFIEQDKNYIPRRKE
jgi:phosphatidylserine/phosphatidylglycerophosphate/cardiolipin synthase-like enzyme